MHYLNDKCKRCYYYRNNNICIAKFPICIDNSLFTQKYTDMKSIIKGKSDIKKIEREKIDLLEHRAKLAKDYIDGHNQVIGISGGLKNDKDKPDWSLLPLETIEGIVKVLTYGAKKYARNNWQKVSTNRNFAALLRHLTKWQAGEEYDEESGLHHLDHALCDLMFIRWKIVARE